jgi:alanyl-tRNA synthetase
MDERRSKLKSAVVLPASKAAGKVMLLAGVTPNLTGKVEAGEMANLGRLAGRCQGRPAGPAQASGAHSEDLPAALASVNYGWNNNYGACTDCGYTILDALVLRGGAVQHWRARGG